MSTPLYDKSCIFRQKKTAHKNVPLKKPFPTPEKMAGNGFVLFESDQFKKTVLFQGSSLIETWSIHASPSPQNQMKI